MRAVLRVRLAKLAKHADVFDHIDRVTQMKKVTIDPIHEDRFSGFNIVNSKCMYFNEKQTVEDLIDAVKMLCEKSDDL